MSFAQFPTQQRVVELLQRSLDRGRLAHGYLFTGSSLGVLEDMARTLAKTLNCQEPPRLGATGTPLDSCDRCLACHKIGHESHADVQWVRPESKTRIITIDQMRNLMQTISLKPSEAAWKVAVIVAADRLNVQAANAFLKTLEEPPSRSVIILLTTEPQRMLETILSRCLRLNFAGDAAHAFDETTANWLAGFSAVAAAEQKGVISRYRLLGVLLNRLNELKAETEKAVSARSPLERYDDIDPKLRERWEDELSAAVEAEYRRQRAELLLAIEWWLRDVWMQTLAFGRELLALPQLGEHSARLASRLTPADAAENLRSLEQMQRWLGTNVQEALALEVGMLRLKF